jgi:uncharacterized membrane protein YgcG
MSDDGRADVSVAVSDAVAAARLGRLLTAGGPPAALDPMREEAALAAFRAARPTVRPVVWPVVRARRTLRVAAATVVSVVALGGVAVAVTTGRTLLPGAGSGTGPASRPPAAVAPDGGTTAATAAAPRAVPTGGAGADPRERLVRPPHGKQESARGKGKGKNGSGKAKGAGKQDKSKQDTGKNGDGGGNSGQGGSGGGSSGQGSSDSGNTRQGRARKHARTPRGQHRKAANQSGSSGPDAGGQVRR